GWGGQFYFSYNFPAIATPITRTNGGGDWTGDPQYFWTYPTSGTNHYSTFKDTMLESRLAANASPMKAMLWDANGVHDYRIANVADIDGSTLTFRRHREVYDTDVKASWSRGMSSPWIMVTSPSSTATR